MSEYRVPARTGRSLVEAKLSIFHGEAKRVDDEAAVQALLAAAHAAHPGANHHAYAYRLGRTGENARFSDDGEPGGTAGRPAMEVLVRASLVYAAVVVSRHFGGTLLGTGGLLRAYGKAAAIAVDDAGVSTMRLHTRWRITVAYHLLGPVQQELRRLKLRSPTVEFGQEAILLVAVPAESAERFRDRIAEVTAGQALVLPADTEYLPIHPADD